MAAGLQTSNACISPSIRDINEITTVLLIFWGSSIPMGLTVKMCDQTGSEKMNDSVLKFQMQIAQLPDKINMKFQW